MPRREAAERSILHVDMDAFFVAVEQRLDPSLRGRPVVVGGTGPRGVVAAASYEARVFGVGSAMPMAHARRLCPHAVFMPGTHSRYEGASREVFALFERFTPLVEGLSVDEAFLDVTGAGRLLGPPAEIAAQIRRATLDELGLPCSVGVAPTKFLAKLASEEAKPVVDSGAVRAGRGVVVIEAGHELAFLHPLPVHRLWGVGARTGDRLVARGIRTVGDLAALPEPAVQQIVGRSLGTHLHRLAWGIDPRPVESQRGVKSISHEETFAADVTDTDRLGVEAVRLSDAVGHRLRQADMAARTVAIKVRFADFATISRATTPPDPVRSGREVARLARELLATVDVSGGVRLLGVVASGLVRPGDHQLRLLTDGGGDAAWDEATGAVDRVRDRFGPDAIGPATLAGSRRGLRTKKRGDQQWGPIDPPGAQEIPAMGDAPPRPS